MKVKVTFTIEVDSEKWANEYGIQKSEVKADIKNYMEVLCNEQIEALGLK